MYSASVGTVTTGTARQRSVGAGLFERLFASVQATGSHAASTSARKRVTAQMRVRRTKRTTHHPRSPWRTNTPAPAPAAIPALAATIAQRFSATLIGYIQCTNLVAVQAQLAGARCRVAGLTMYQHLARQSGLTVLGSAKCFIHRAGNFRATRPPPPQQAKQPASDPASTRDELHNSPELQLSGTVSRESCMPTPLRPPDSCWVIAGPPQPMPGKEDTAGTGLASRAGQPLVTAGRQTVAVAGCAVESTSWPARRSRCRPGQGRAGDLELRGRAESKEWPEEANALCVGLPGLSERQRELAIPRSRLFAPHF